MNVLIVDNGTRHIKALTNLFLDHDVTVMSGQDFQADFVEPDTLVVLSGSKNHPVLYDHSFYSEQVALVKHYNGPIIGICAGFEVIAKTLGATITRRKKRLHRLIKVNNKRVYEAHRYSVKRVPTTLQILATSRSGVEIIKHHTKPIYGLQFHPEVHTPRNDGVEFLNEILAQIKG